MRCNICLHRCDLKENETGKCHVIANRNGLINLYNNIVSNISIESIQKRPFFHFGDGNYLVVGGFGCNFTCPWCQNFKVSQTFEGNKKEFDPQSIINLAKEKKVCGIAFSYNEPTIFYDYILKISELRDNLRIVVKTNGYSTPEILEKLLPVVDAWNVDIKGDDNYYRTIGGHLDGVLENINIINSFGTHLEISYIVVPSIIDNWYFHEKLRDTIPDVPLHLLYCYPIHLLTESYNKDKLIRLRAFFAEKIKYVYISNVYASHFLKYRKEF